MQTFESRIRMSNKYIHLVCDVGYEGASCDACEVGYYKSITGPGSCISCGTGKTTTSTGTGSQSECGE